MSKKINIVKTGDTTSIVSTGSPGSEGYIVKAVNTSELKVKPGAGNRIAYEVDDSVWNAAPIHGVKWSDRVVMDDLTGIADAVEQNLYNMGIYTEADLHAAKGNLQTLRAAFNSALNLNVMKLFEEPTPTATVKAVATPAAKK